MSTNPPDELYTNKELQSIEQSSSPNSTMTVSPEPEQMKHSVQSVDENVTITESTESVTENDEVKPKEVISDDVSQPSSNNEEMSDDAIRAGDMAKRFLPAYKKANAALTFPEKMMNLMKYVEEKNKTEKEFCISWLPEGKAFVIYNIKEFTSSVIPKFFKASKFCSFTRKLYRWGFRQLNRGIGPDEPIIFGNEYFQRDNADLMVNMRSITAASIRKRESDLLRHMLASKKRAMMSLDGASNAVYQDSKHLNMLLSNNFDQKQQNASLSSAANAMAQQQRFGGSGLTPDLGHIENHSLHMMYQSLTNKNGPGDGIGPIISDAVSQMNNPSHYSNFNGSGSSHPQDFNHMSSMSQMQMQNSSSSMMGGAGSNYMSHMNGHNGANGMSDSTGGGRMNNMNGGRMNGLSNMNGNFNNNGYSGSLNNNMFSSDAMYGNGSTNNRGSPGFNLPQQYNNGGASENASMRKSFMNHPSKHSFHTHGANHESGSYGNYSNMPMNLNINQHLFNLSTPGTAGGSEDLYFAGQYGERPPII